MSHELRAKAEEYLRIRRALGFKLEDHARSLSAFIDHLERIGASTPTLEASTSTVACVAACTGRILPNANALPKSART
jgi:hypothetical protein